MLTMLSNAAGSIRSHVCSAAWSHTATCPILLLPLGGAWARCVDGGTSGRELSSTQYAHAGPLDTRPELLCPAAGVCFWCIACAPRGVRVPMGGTPRRTPSIHEQAGALSACARAHLDDMAGMMMTWRRACALLVSMGSVRRHQREQHYTRCECCDGEPFVCIPQWAGVLRACQGEGCRPVGRPAQHVWDRKTWQNTAVSPVMSPAPSGRKWGQHGRQHHRRWRQAVQGLPLPLGEA
jgi:hypothetical protein